MKRDVRVLLHKKQERLIIKKGVPNIQELDEGVPVLRQTSDGLVQFIRYNNVLYKQQFTKV